MKNSTLRRIVALTVAVCLLVGLSPLLKSITGFADANAAFVARISGGPQQSGATFSEAFAKANTKNVTSIAMIAGELSEADITSLVAQGLHTGLNSITMVTPPPSISSADVFKGFPDNRILAVPAADISSYRIVDDGIVDDNFWFGWNLMEATPEAINVVKEIQEIANPASVMIDAPAVGGTPQFDLAVGTGYTSTITWKNGAELHNGAFAENTVYTADVVLTSVEGFKFAANASASVPTGTITSYAVAGGDISSNTLSFTVTFANTTPGAVAPVPPANDGTSSEPTSEPILPPDNGGTSSEPTSEPILPPDNGGTSSGTSSEATSSEEWKPQVMGGFANAPMTRDIPVPYANGVPEVGTQKIAFTLNQSTKSIEIGDSAGLQATLVPGTQKKPVEVPQLDEPGTFDDDNDPATPVAPFTKTTVVKYEPTTYLYDYKWEETVKNPKTKFIADPQTNSGQVVTPGEIPNFATGAYDKSHLGLHKFTLTVKETAEISGKVTVKYDPPGAVPATETGFVNGVKETVFNSTTNPKYKTEETAIIAPVEITVNKIKPSIIFTNIIQSPIDNEGVDASAKVTGKDGIPLYDNTLSDSNTDIIPPPATTTPPDGNFKFTVKFEANGQESTQTKAINDIFTALIKIRTEGNYTFTAKYSGDANYLPATATMEYDHRLVPDKITSNHIGVISIDSPVAGKVVTSGADVELPIVPNTDGIHYSLDLKWYAVNNNIANADFTDFSNDSLVTNRFYEGKRHKAVVTLKANSKHTFVPNTIATFQALGAIVSQPKYIDSIIDTRFNSQNSIQYVILFPSTMSENALKQTAFGFNNYAVPITKTYGDPDFILQAYGGNGKGNVTYESSDPNILRVMSNPNGTASIKIMQSGKATISAKKEGSLEGDNGIWYEPVTAKTNEIVVAPKELTVSVDDKTIKVGSKTTTFKVRVRGFVNGDTESNIYGFILPIAAAAVEDVAILGTYDISISGGESTLKYKFKFVPGVLTVNETGIPPTTSNTTNTVIANGNSAYIHEPRNDVTLTRKDAQFFETGVEMTVDNQTSTISVVESDIINRNINAAVPGKSMANVYNIALSLDNENYSLNTDVTTQLRVTNAIKSKYTDLGIVHVDAAGNVTSIPSTLTSNGEYITFTTNYVGKFAIVGKLRVAFDSTTPPVVPPVTGNPQTGDSTPSFPSATALLGGTIFVAATRKEDEIIC